MLEHSIHQFGTLQAFNIAGPVVDVGRGHQLTALFDACDDDRVQVGAGRIDAGRVSRGA